MRMPMKMVPEHTIQQYNLKNGFVYVKIRRAIYSLPPTGRPANDQLKEFLEPEVYFEVKHAPELWRHKTRPIQFTFR